MELFVEHRKRGKELLEQSKERNDNVLECYARQHFIYALNVSTYSLKSVLISSSNTNSSLHENNKTMIQSLKPLFDISIELHKEVEILNYSLGILFDQTFAELEIILFAYKRMILNMQEDQKTSSDVIKCYECSSTTLLHEDTDNLGTYYCLKCWQSYDEMQNESLLQEMNQPSLYLNKNGEQDRIQKYSLKQLLEYRSLPLSNTMRYNELGFKDEESMFSMIQRLQTDKRQHPNITNKNNQTKKSKKSKKKNETKSQNKVNNIVGDGLTNESLSEIKEKFINETIESNDVQLHHEQTVPQIAEGTIIEPVTVTTLIDSENGMDL